MSTAPLPQSPSSLQRHLVAEARYEVIPMKNLEAQIDFLPAGCSVSVTCSPAKGIAATQELTLRLQAKGHLAVPHFSARLTTGPDHVAELAAWCKANGLTEIFLVAGDAPEAAGPYEGAVDWLRDFLGTDSGVTRIGITSYPDGHAMIDPAVVHEALHAKQALLAEAGVEGFASTQMCFDAEQIKRWLAAERKAGFTLPVHIGVPGVIDRTKLITMSVRLGIGSSVRYVKKNKGIMGRFFTPGGYDPTKLIAPLSKAGVDLGIEGLHVFTFNNVDATAQWQQAQLTRLG